ncbi:uncharacterized protein [Eurosta solidaginis]|uniref:uncharacterized protein n=1 Tax=Eurosta solidaginis TaxID=178769 RepID=UPI0035313ED9
MLLHRSVLICWFSFAMWPEGVLAQMSNLQCGQTSHLKRIVIRNPVQLLTMPTCQYTIRRSSNHICQLRIQFESFELQQPTIDIETSSLVCTDSFTAGRFTLCGDNSGQHIYLPFTMDTTFITLNFNVPSHLAQSKWHLVVDQLVCPPSPSHMGDSLPPILSSMVNNLLDMRNIFSRFINDLELLAPFGCDQYYTQPSGLIKSFNYRDGVNTQYMSNLKYTICIKQLPEVESIEYTVNKFSLSSELPEEFYNDACHPLISTEGRQNDYLMIPNTYFADNHAFQPTYICGQALTAGQALIGSGPFVLYFSSDDLWNEEETGFSTEYRMITAK